MVVGVVPEHLLQRVPGKSVSAVVVDSLQGREAEEDHSSTSGKTGDLVGKTSADSVHQESLEGVVVESAKGIRNVETVVARVESF